MRPRMLVLDEATRHLDASTQTRVLELVRQLGCTCFHVTHRQEVTAHCTRALLVEAATVAEVRLGADA